MAYLLKQESSGHWYQVNKDGTVVPRYEAGLREARKELLFVSPTTIEKDIIANPTLGRWIANELAKAILATPRNPGEQDEDYIARCQEQSKQVSKDAATKGTDIHKLIEEEAEAWAVGEMSGYPSTEYQKRAREFFEDHLSKIVSPESMVYDNRIGVAGRMDLLAIDSAGEPVVIDFKTQRIRNGKPAFYNSFPRQLAFYAHAAWRNGLSTTLPSIVSVVVDSNDPSKPFYVKKYSREEQGDSYTEFLCAAWLWSREKKYWPCGQWYPEFMFHDGASEPEIPMDINVQ